MMKKHQTFKELTTLLQLMFTLTSVLFLHNKWQQNEHDTHLYDSSLWKYSTHQTCYAMYQSTKNIYNCNCENREKHQLKHKSPICCICAWKSAYCVRTKERGGHQREGGTTESDGYLYSVGEILSKHKGIGIRLNNIQYGVRRNESCWLVPVNSDKFEMNFSMQNKDQSSLIMRINFNRLLRPRNDHYDFIHLDNK